MQDARKAWGVLADVDRDTYIDDSTLPDNFSVHRRRETKTREGPSVSATRKTRG
jgi:hypothetical protein